MVSKRQDEGFVALVMVLMVSGILLAVVLQSSISAGLFFDQATKKQYRAMNYYYAYDCIDRAILALAHDYFFTVSSALDFADFHCSILSMQIQGDLRTIKTVGNYMNANVYRSATVRLHDSSVEIVSID